MPVRLDLAVAAALAGAGLGYLVPWEGIEGILGSNFEVMDTAMPLILSKSTLWGIAAAVLCLYTAARLLHAAIARRNRSEGSDESEEAEAEPEPSQSTAAQAEQSGTAVAAPAPPHRRISVHERTVDASTQGFECPRTFERSWTRELRVKPPPVAASGHAYAAPTTPGQRPDRRSVIEAYRRDPYALDMATLVDLLRDSRAGHAPPHTDTPPHRRAETHRFTAYRT